MDNHRLADVDTVDVASIAFLETNRPTIVFGYIDEFCGLQSSRIGNPTADTLVLDESQQRQMVHALIEYV